MPLTPDKLEPILRRMVALEQRFGELKTIAQRLIDPVFWRSREGDLAVGGLTPEQLHELAARIKQDLGEAELIITDIRSYLG